MQRSEWLVAVRYFEACWSSFSPAELELLLAPDVVFVSGNTVTNGQAAVMHLFCSEYFEKVEIDKTHIVSFELVPQAENVIAASYAIFQVRCGQKQQLQAIDVLTLDKNSLIRKIERIKP